MMDRLLIALLICHLAPPLSTLNFKPKIFKIEKMDVCPGGKQWPAYFDEISLATPSRNKFLLNGKIVVKETFSGELKLTMDVSRCNLDMSHCEQFDRLVIPKLCPKIYEKSSVWAPFVRAISPRIGCPLLAGSYTLTNGSFDLSLVSRMPIENYRWMVYNKVMALGNKTESKVLCMDAEVSIVTAKKRLK